MHEHHPILQSVGGKDEGTIQLCSECHGQVHKEITRLCRYYKEGKGGACSISWKTCRHSQEVILATEVVMTGVKSVISFEGNKSSNKITVTLDSETYQTLLALKKKINAKNIPQAIQLCIQFTAKYSGLV